jgi:quercetin dioxygenase-like cupin family protein
MVTKPLTTFGLALLVVGATSAGTWRPGTRAQSPITVEILTPRSLFTDDVDLQIRYRLEGNPTAVINSLDPSHTVVARITVQSGAQFPWHTHPGPVIVNVANGELVYVQATDCVERRYPVGAAFIDPGRGNVHTAFNATGGETVFVATFFEVPATGPLTIPVPAPANCQVNGGTQVGHATHGM